MNTHTDSGRNTNGSQALRNSHLCPAPSLCGFLLRRGQLTILFALLSAVLVALTSPALAAPRLVVVFGDSITQGGALPVADRARVWVALVETNSTGRLKLVNEGKGGRPTASVKEFEAMLTRHPRADQLVIALGTNDSRDLTDECVPKAVANLRTMVVKARQAWGDPLRVLLVGPPNINKAALGPTKPIANEREAKLREQGAAFEKLARELGCEFTSLFGVVPDASLTKDGVHPDAAGNEVIARALLPILLGSPTK